MNMKSLVHAFVRGAGIALICALMAPTLAQASPKPVNPEAIHARIVKRGAGNWICVEEKNGLALVGRITSIEEQSFGLQLQNYPEITTVAYGNVLRLRTGLSNKAAVALIAGSIGASVAVAVIMHSQFENNKAKFPPMPVVP
jgi:hypothetical protein